MKKLSSGSKQQNKSEKANDPNQSPVYKIISRLECVRKVPNGYRAMCPAHYGTLPNLLVSQTDDGRVSIHCYAGCTVKEVLGAIHLEPEDLKQGATRRKPMPPDHFEYLEILHSPIMQNTLYLLNVELEIIFAGLHRAIQEPITTEDILRLRAALTHCQSAREALCEKFE